MPPLQAPPASRTIESAHPSDPSEKSLSLPQRLALLGGAALVVVAFSLYIVVTPDEVWASDGEWAYLIAPAAALAAYLLVQNGYLIARELRWRRRKRFERAYRRKLVIPATVRAPVDYEGVKFIDEQQRVLLRRPPDHQRKMYTRGVVIAALPSFAVILAAIHGRLAAIVLGPTASRAELHLEETSLVTGFSFAELGAMIMLIVLVTRLPAPARPWVQSRTRAELLRREQYLRLAEVGPYLNRDSGQAHEEAGKRVIEAAKEQNRVEKEEDGRLLKLVVPRSPADFTRWIDNLYTGKSRSLDDVLDRARTYRWYRIAKQLAWFADAARSHRRSETTIVRGIKFAIWLTIGVLILELAAHFFSHVRYANSISTVAGVVTLFLPPLCAFMLSVGELFSWRRLAASYEHMEFDLNQELDAMDKFIASLEADPDLPDASRKFQASVLHVETTLSNELLHWIQLTQREKYELGA
jgi:hypothetical protein